MNSIRQFFVGTLAFVMAVTALAGVGVNTAAAAAGDLVKSSTSSTVYVVDADGVTLHLFPNAAIFESWNYSFDNVKTMDLSSYTMGSAAEARSGSLLKSFDKSDVYYVADGTLYPIVSETVFYALGLDFGDLFETSQAFVDQYPMGSTIMNADWHVKGQLIKYASDPAVYLIGDSNTYRAFQSESAFYANRLSFATVLTIPDTEVYTAGAMVTGFEHGISTPMGVAGGPAVPVDGSGVTVSLSASTPAAKSIIADSTNGGQALVPFTTFNFTAAADGSATIKTLKLKRSGISSDTTLDNLYLYNGSTKLTDGGSLSSGYVTFNNANGLFTVPAGQTMTITVRGDLASSASAGNTIGFTLESASDVTSSGATVNGSFPAAGNLMTVAEVTDFGKMYIATSSVATSVDADSNDVEVWKGTFYSSNQKMGLEYVKFTSLGSIQSDDLSNFRLYDGGTLVASGTMNSEREVIFDMSGSPVNFTVGQSKLLKVLADVDKGSTRTYNFTIQEATDVVVMDQNYNAYVAVYPGYLSVGNFAVIQMASDTTINAGSLSVVKATDSPTGNVSKDGTNVSIAKWELRAVGEDMKVKNFDVNLASSSAGEGGLDNGKLFYNGVQVGSTKDLTEAIDVNFTFGSSLIVSAGTTGILELKADIKTATSAAVIADGTFVASLGAGSSNVQKMSSLNYGSYPGSDVAANTLTIKAGSLTISSYAGFGNQTKVAGATETKVASAVLTSGSAEGVTVTSLTVALDAAEYNAATSSNLMIKDEAGNLLATEKVVPSATNIFPVNISIPASGSKIVDIYVSFTSNADAGTWQPTLAADGNGMVTSNAVTYAATALQTTTLGTGSLSATDDASQPVSNIILAGTSKQFMNAVKFSALYEDFEVQELTVLVNSITGTATDDVGKIYLEYPTETGTGTAEGYMSSGSVTFTGLNFFVPRDDKAVLKMYADVPTILAGADSGDEFSLDLDMTSSTYKHVGLGSGTVVTTPGSVASADITGNGMVVRKTRPTFSLVSLPGSILANGTMVLSKFTVTADAAEDVSLYQLKWDVSTTGVTVASPVLYDAADNSQVTASGTPSLGTGTTITMEFAAEEVISAGSSKTFYLSVTASGSDGTGDSIITRLTTPYSSSTLTDPAYSAVANGALIIWSDNSAASHSLTSDDWGNAEYVKTLPSDYQTLQSSN